MSKKGSRGNIKAYTEKIEKFLAKNKDSFYSELQIAEKVFGLKVNKDGNVPKSQKHLRKLLEIRKALKLLMEQKTIKGSLIEDPRRKENVMHYSITDQRVLDLQ